MSWIVCESFFFFFLQCMWCHSSLCFKENIICTTPVHPTPWLADNISHHTVTGALAWRLSQPGAWKHSSLWCSSLPSMQPTNWTTCWPFLLSTIIKVAFVPSHHVGQGALLTQQQMVLWNKNMGGCHEYQIWSTCETTEMHTLFLLTILKLRAHIHTYKHTHTHY